MGRNKPGKPRRPRKPQQYTLQQLQPPGEGYEEWFQPRPGMKPEQLQDAGLAPEAVALMRLVCELAPLYKNRVPKAALYLDNLIESGHLPVFQDGDNGKLVPIQEMAALYGGLDIQSVRESIHTLHSIGALLVVTDDENDVNYVRMVAKKPEHPGQPWLFVGDPDAVTRKVCLPDGMWEALPMDVAAAVSYMRACRARLETPDPAVYGTHAGVNGTEHAKELFTAALASGYVDEKGCEVCPAGHLCTRTDD